MNICCIIRELIHGKSHGTSSRNFRDNKKGRAILLSLSITAALIKFCGIVIWNVIPEKLIEKLQKKIKRSTELGLKDIHILEEHHAESEYVSNHE